MENNLPLFQQAISSLISCHNKWETYSTNSAIEIETWQKMQSLCEDILLLETPATEDENLADDDAEINRALCARARI